MTGRTFAPWVEPVAQELRATRAEIVRAANQILPEVWVQPSPLEGWTYKDLLAHLATGDWVCQTILGAVTENRPVEIDKVANIDWVNEGNVRLLEERKQRLVVELIAEVQTEGEETQELLARLTPDDEGRKQADAPMSLVEYLRAFSGHDRAHLEQLKTAHDQVML